MAGMLVREREGVDVCWVYVAPHAFDHPLFQALETALVRLRVGPRIALGLAMKFTTVNLEAGRYDAQIRALEVCHHRRAPIRSELR